MTDADAGVIFIAATPIGNVGDASARLVDALQTADVIAAEDTRRLRALCSRLGIEPTGRIVAFHDHNEGEKAADLIAEAEAGQTVLVVSDAGTPSVSDPGYRLVDEARKGAVRVVPLPGPSAALAALSVSGLPTDRFVFEGFLPRKGAERNRRLRALQSEDRTIILFESPRRTASTLKQLADEVGPERPAALCRELTKTHEEVKRATLAELAQYAGEKPVLGEVTLVISGADQVSAQIDVLELAAEAVQLAQTDGIRLKEAAAKIAAASGVRPNAVFKAALEVAKD